MLIQKFNTLKKNMIKPNFLKACALKSETKEYITK